MINLDKRDPFQIATDVWFESLIAFGKESSNLRTEMLRLSKCEIPDRRRLERMLELFKHLNVDLRRDLTAQGQAIMAGTFSGADGQFRFRYNRISHLRGQCSATSSFFSMIQQALLYENDEGDQDD